MLHFAPCLSTLFEECALNPFLLLTLFSKHQFYSCFEHFSEKVSESNSILHFGSFLSGRTQNQTLQSNPQNPQTPKHPKPQTPKHPNTQTPKHPNTQTPKHPNTQTPKHPNTQTPKHPNTQTPKHPNTPKPPSLDLHPASMLNIAGNVQQKGRLKPQRWA